MGVLQELLEDSGRSSKLEPLISCMADQLSSAAPYEAGTYPITLKQLCQRCIDAEVPGSDASLQVRT